ncbi:MAG: 4-oxalocrotonate tautomerase family protein [Firmicutes bacterium]|nr:4-oxalocrotonate tautomerase family protein [Bacillota bacterium]
MPYIFVQMWSGKTEDQKRQLAKAITDAMENIGKVTRENVWVVFEDVEKSNWAIGGQLASEMSKG